MQLGFVGDLPKNVGSKATCHKADGCDEAGLGCVLSGAAGSFRAPFKKGRRSFQRQAQDRGQQDAWLSPLYRRPAAT